MRYVFIYGTLRAGEINDIGVAAARHGIAAPQFIGRAAVAGRLYDFGDYPGLVQDEAAGLVRGDVYAIEDALVPVMTGLVQIAGWMDERMQERQDGALARSRPAE